MMKLKRDDWGQWDNFVGLIVWMLDLAVKAIGDAPGLVVASRHECSAGLFFWQNHSSFWDAWVEPGAFMLRMGRVELQVDRPLQPQG
jgi:hypothetical protein